MATLTSPHNPWIKELRRAIRRGAQTDEGLVVAEGPHLVEEAARSGCEIPAVFVTESAEARFRGRLDGFQVSTVSDKILAEISATETSQGVIALVRPPQWTMEQVFQGTALVLILDGLQDPGNAGTVLRAAEAFGATGVLALRGTVNHYNPKCVRASAGSVFRVPFVTGVDLETALTAIEQYKAELFALVADGARDLGETNLTGPCAIVLGSEAHGVSEELKAKATGVRIATVGVESLNAALAAGIALYAGRQQRLVDR